MSRRAHHPDPNFATSLANGLALLQCFRLGDAVLSNKVLAERTGLSKATVSRLTYTLALRGLLQYDDDLRRYRLGAAALALGYPLLASMKIRQLARPYMAELAARVNGAVSLCIRDRLQMVFIESTRSHDGAPFRPDIGASIPMLTTSTGLAWLCQADAALRHKVTDALRLADPAVWHEQEARLERAVREYAAHGFCNARGAWREDIQAVAVPMQTSVDGEILVFNCGIPPSPTTPGRLERDAGPWLVGMVRTIEARLEQP